jgi:hypothetical protein
MSGSWQELHDHAQERFGNQPVGAKLEAELVEIYEQRPEAMRLAIDHVAGQYARGKIHSPWAVLRVELERDARRATVQPDPTGEREQAVRLAETRVRNLAHLVDNEHQLLAEIFSPPTLTADHDTLAQLELPATPLGQVLARTRDAAIARLDTHGREPIPGTGGLLRNYDTPELRARIVGIWRASRRAPDIAWNRVRKEAYADSGSTIPALDSHGHHGA